MVLKIVSDYDPTYADSTFDSFAHDDILSTLRLQFQAEIKAQEKLRRQWKKEEEAYHKRLVERERIEAEMEANMRNWLGTISKYNTAIEQRARELQCIKGDGEGEEQQQQQQQQLTENEREPLRTVQIEWEQERMAHEREVAKWQVMRNTMDETLAIYAKQKEEHERQQQLWAEEEERHKQQQQIWAEEEKRHKHKKIQWVKEEVQHSLKRLTWASEEKEHQKKHIAWTREQQMLEGIANNLAIEKKAFLEMHQQWLEDETARTDDGNGRINNHYYLRIMTPINELSRNYTLFIYGIVNKVMNYTCSCGTHKGKTSDLFLDYPDNPTDLEIETIDKRLQCNIVCSELSQAVKGIYRYVSTIKWLHYTNPYASDHSN
ncbi:hypothetical protein BDF22DRAFT_697744 [Syncephalis plumigaleata]|nr:hypothetical protein BDF22DRAFT_697744 [Syncephalis plumigaleata]